MSVVLTCRACGESLREGIVTISEGEIVEESGLCNECIEADSNDDADGRLAVVAEPSEGPTCDEFVAAMDPALSAWLDSRPADLWSNRDMRMAGTYGELAALFELARLSEESDSIACVFEAYLAGRTALARRRNSLDFTRSLERRMAESKGTDDGGGTDARQE